MSIEKVSIDEMIVRMSSEAKRLGFSNSFIWADFVPRLRKFAVWYDHHGLVWYDPVATQKIVDEHEERFNKGEYSAAAFSRVRTSARRLNEFYLTGTFRVHMPRKGTRYVIRPENEHLISAFIEWKKYGPNTRDDVRWVLRKYFYYRHMTPEAFGVMLRSQRGQLLDQFLALLLRDELRRRYCID